MSRLHTESSELRVVVSPLEVPLPPSPPPSPNFDSVRFFSVVRPDPAMFVNKELLQPLPFTLEEALEDPAKCRAQVCASTWELRVIIPILHSNCQLESPFRLPPLVEEASPSSNASELYEGKLMKNDRQGREVAQLYAQVKRALVEHRDGWSIEVLWRIMLKGDRIVVVLEALEKVMHESPKENMFERHLAPDFTGRALAVGDPLKFCKILRTIVDSATVHQGQNYTPIVDTFFDMLVSIDRDPSGPPLSRGSRFKASTYQHARHRFIARVMLFIVKGVLASFDGVQASDDLSPSPEPYPIALLQKPRLPLADASTLKPSPRPAARLSSSWSQYFDVLDFPFGNSEQMKRNQEEAKLAPRFERCEACYRFVEEIQELVEQGKQFFYCSKCALLSLPRYHPFCSQDCFKASWKLGGHRTVCGKKYSDLSLTPFGFLPLPPKPPLSIFIQLLQCPSTTDIDQHSLPPVYRFFGYSESFLESPPSPLRYVGVTSMMQFLDVTDPALSPRVHQLLSRLIETRNENDLKNFILLALEAAQVPKTIWWRFMVSSQIHFEWDVDSKSVERWLPEYFGELKEELKEEIKRLEEIGDSSTLRDILYSYMCSPRSSNVIE